MDEESNIDVDEFVQSYGLSYELNVDRMSGAICPGCEEWMNVVFYDDSKEASFFCPNPVTDDCIRRKDQ